jgi:hypothetical protein
MNFTLWQIDKLRRGLHAYRVLKAANGHLRPWKAVIDDLLLSPATQSVYPKDGQKPEFREEALRRFAEGGNLLLPDKLADVGRFLVAARVVTPEELEEGADVATDNLLLHRFFAHGAAEQVSSRLAQLSTDYRATQRADGRTHEFVLRLAPQPLDGFVLAEERVRVAAAEAAVSRYDKKDGNVQGASVRKGCALITSQYPTLHIFVRGSSTDDFIHYVRVGTDGMQKLDQLLLVRSGVAAPEIEGHVEGDDLLARYNIVRFKPTTSRPVLPPEKPKRGKSRTKILVKGKVVSL